jgi:hypothetical protein
MFKPLLIKIKQSVRVLYTDDLFKFNCSHTEKQIQLYPQHQSHQFIPFYLIYSIITTLKEQIPILPLFLWNLSISKQNIIKYYKLPELTVYISHTIYTCGEVNDLYVIISNFCTWSIRPLFPQDIKTRGCHSITGFKAAMRTIFLIDLSQSKFGVWCNLKNKNWFIDLSIKELTHCSDPFKEKIKQSAMVF